MSEGWTYVLAGPARRDLRGLPAAVRERVFAALDRLAETHMGDVRKLEGRPGDWALRIGDYRAIFERHPGQRVIVVVHVLHRREAYRG